MPPQSLIDNAVPLVVDLDGTLIKTDLLVESAVRLVCANPLYLFLFPFWLFLGKHVLKREIARRVRLDPALLPYNLEFMRYLRAQRAAGRTLVLATAAPELLAAGVYRVHALFTELLSSDDSVNLAGSRKRDALVSRFGHGGFDYAGNATPDLAVWRCARKSILVNPAIGVEAMARAIGNFDRVFVNDASTLGAFLRSLRMRQWLKNLLVLAPLFAAHRWGDTSAVFDVLTVLLSFSLTSSAVYQINDIVDLDADRSHPNKRCRPMAAGDMPITLGIGAAVLLLVSGLLLAWQVSVTVLSLMLLYLLVTCAYSFFLKSQAVIDLVVLAGLYTLRIVAGALALGVMPSSWLLAFSMFVFLSLAALKRCAELRSASLPPGTFIPGRGYEGNDLPFLTGFGASLGSGAVVILALFINDAETARQYALPELLWLLCPLLVYWIGRMWIKTGRGEMHDDPIVFASKDKVSVVVALLGLIIVFAAV